jgi:branched-chain amino acid transport system permease protein
MTTGFLKGRRGVLAALLVAVVAAPLLLRGSPFVAFIVGMTFIYVLWSSGMNLLYGYVGLMPLMFAGIAGIGAYGTVRLVQSLEWSFWVAMPVAVLGAALTGVVLGLPALRLKGFYFALSSLVIQTVISLAFVYFVSLTNGDSGIIQIQAPDIPFTGGARLDRTGLEILVGVIAWLGIVAIGMIEASEFGRRLVAIREDDVLAESIGIDIVRSKLYAFFCSSVYAAVGGALYACYVGYISPRSFDILASTTIWLMVAFGGRGTIAGPVIGSLALAPLPFALLEYADWKDVVYGILVILVMVFMPSGVYGHVARRMGWSRE